MHEHEQIQACVFGPNAFKLLLGGLSAEARFQFGNGVANALVLQGPGFRV